MNTLTGKWKNGNRNNIRNKQNILNNQSYTSLKASWRKKKISIINKRAQIEGMADCQQKAIDWLPKCIISMRNKVHGTHPSVAQDDDYCFYKFRRPPINNNHFPTLPGIINCSLKECWYSYSKSNGELKLNHDNCKSSFDTQLNRGKM